VSLDELISRFKPVEEKMNRNNKQFVAKLNLMEDELVSWLSSRLKVTRFENSDSSKEGSSSGKRVVVTVERTMVIAVALKEVAVQAAAEATAVMAVTS
jgi:hypothetical protein